MQRYILLLSLLLLLLPEGGLFAQQPTLPDLTETFIAADEQFSFKYPASWEADLSAETPIFSVPIKSTGMPQEGISIELETLTLFVTLLEEQVKTTTAEVALAQAQKDGLATDFGDPINYTITGRTVTQLDTLTPLFNFTYLALEAFPNTYFVMTLSGTPDQIVNTIPSAFAVLNSVRVRKDTSPLEALDVEMILPQSYTSQTLGVNFDYPDGWTVEEAETYVLITAPNGFSMGLSQYGFDKIPADVTSLPVYEVELTVGDIQAQVPDLTVSEISEFELGGRAAARVDIQDNQGTQMSLVTVQFDDSTVGRISIIGSPSQVMQMTQVIYGIAATLQPN